MSQQEKNGSGEVGDPGAGAPAPPNVYIDRCPCLVAPERITGELPKSPDAWAAVLANAWRENNTELTPLVALVHQIRLFGVGVFLLGMGTTHSEIWINALVDAKTLDSEERADSTKPMSERYNAVVEVFTNIFDTHAFVFFPEKKQMLKDMLKLIFVVEREFFPRGKICVEQAIFMAKAFPFFREECDRVSAVMKMPRYKYSLRECDEEALHFGVLFFCKLVQDHVYHGAFYLTPLTHVLTYRLRTRDLENSNQLKIEGNLLFKKGDYKAAIDKYTQAMKSDFANCHLYGNRAQCYINLKRYRDALCDCHRALFVNPKWYKGSYRAAEACLKLGDRWDEAKRFIEQSLSDIRSSDNPDKDLVLQIEDLHRQILDYVRKKRSETRREEEDSVAPKDQAQDQPTSEDGAGKARVEGHAGRPAANSSHSQNWPD